MPRVPRPEVTPPGQEAKRARPASWWILLLLPPPLLLLTPNLTLLTLVLRMAGLEKTTERQGAGLPGTVPPQPLRGRGGDEQAIVEPLLLGRAPTFPLPAPSCCGYCFLASAPFLCWCLVREGCPVSEGGIRARLPAAQQR